MFPLILIALGAVGAFALYRRHQQALALLSYQQNTQAGPTTGHGVNLDSAGPFNTGFLGSIYEGAPFTLSSTRWPISLGPAIPNQAVGFIAVSVIGGPPNILGVVGCMADPTGRTISLCAATPTPNDVTLASTPLPAGLYKGDFLTPLGERGSFSFVVAPGTAVGAFHPGMPSGGGGWVQLQPPPSNNYRSWPTLAQQIASAVSSTVFGDVPSTWGKDHQFTLHGVRYFARFIVRADHTQMQLTDPSLWFFYQHDASDPVTDLYHVYQWQIAPSAAALERGI